MYKKMNKIILMNLILSIGLSYSSLGQDRTISYLWDASSTMQDREIEISHLSANLVIKPFDTLVTAKADFNFKVLRDVIDSLVFSVPELKISEIRINNKEAHFKIKGSDVIVYPPNKLTWLSENNIFFNYSVKPTDGLYFVG